MLGQQILSSLQGRPNVRVVLQKQRSRLTEPQANLWKEEESVTSHTHYSHAEYVTCIHAMGQPRVGGSPVGNLISISFSLVQVSGDFCPNVQEYWSFELNSSSYEHSVDHLDQN